MSKYCLKKLFWLWQCFEYAWSVLQRFKYAPGPKYANLEKWQGCEYARITQGLHWIWLSNPQYALMMPQYMWIPLAMLSMFAYAWKKQISEYAEILNGLRSQYKLPSSYRDKDVFRTLSNIYDGAFWEKNNAWMQGDRLKFFRIVTVLRN